MIFLLATHNMKKRAELGRILAPLGVEVQTAEEAGVPVVNYGMAIAWLTGIYRRVMKPLL